MGYRSDVHAVFYTANKESFPLLKLFFDENFPKELRESVRVIDDANFEGFYFEEEDVKWYPSYPEVQGFDAFVKHYRQHISEEVAPTASWCYEFICIGEDDNDIERTTDGFDVQFVLGLNRSVECGVKLKPKED